MKLPSRNFIYKIEITTNNDASPTKTTKTRSYDKTSIFILFLTIFLTTGSVTCMLYRSQHHQTEKQLTIDEFRKLVQEIFVESNELLKNGGVMVEVQVLDKNHNLLWFKPVDEESLMNQELIGKEIVDNFKGIEHEILSEAVIRESRSVDSSRTREYVVSHQTQFVNCDHFKPIPRGKYLVPPSLNALHTCYQYGVKMDEINRGILKREDEGEFRYNLQELYVACHDVFNDQMDELTSELKADYEKCKWSGALNITQQNVIEERFASYFVSSNAPGNLEVISPPYPSTTLPPPTTTSSPALIDFRVFVECSHVETELFEDSFESPSPEALQRCHKFGVTYDELHQGISQNPQQERTRLDVGNLYVPCQDIFNGNLDYLTNELKNDYRRCKRMKVLSMETQIMIERKFYEAFYDEREITNQRSQHRKTLSSTTTTTTDTITTTSEDVESQTTTTVNVPAAFANCKRVKNKEYYICIKVIATYNSPVINV